MTLENLEYRGELQAKPSVFKVFHQMHSMQPAYRALFRLIDFVGYPLAALARKGKSLDNVSSIVVLRLDHIGDMILTTPVFRALKSRFPNAKLTVLCRRLTAPLLRLNPYVDEVISLDVPWFSRETNDGWSKTTAFARKNHARFDIGIELHTDPRNILLLSKISKTRVGYASRCLGFMLNIRVHYRRDKLHIIERSLDVVRALGADASPKTELFLTKAEINRARELLFRNKANLRSCICISPVAARANKNWLHVRFAELADRLAEKHKSTVVFCGSKADKPVVDKILAGGKKQHLNLTGQLDLRELAAVIKLCKLFIGPDTGPMHIARAVETPLIGLFGPVDPAVWGYDEQNYRSIYHELPCSFCDKPGCSNRERYECMNSITVDEVMAMAEKLLH